MSNKNSFRFPEAMRPVPRTLDRTYVLGEIDDDLDQAELRAESQSFVEAQEYCVRAGAMIELLEALDCGSCGGYDRERGQPRVESARGIKNLRERARWLRAVTVESARRMKAAREEAGVT